jgi:hypothetical protein
MRTAHGPWSTRRLAIPLAAASAAVLVTMAIVSMITGATQAAHEWYQPPAAYAAGLLAHPGALRGVFGLDVGEQLGSGRWVGFVLGFVLAAAWLRASPDPAPSTLSPRTT